MEDLEHAIALTGGIATGKSTVASFLQLYGYKVIDADQIAHIVLEQQQDSVLRVFGDSILGVNGVDRKKLGAIVFADREKMLWLEDILHPFIRAEILRESLVLEQSSVPFFVDLPIYFEKPDVFGFLKKNVLVYAPYETQLRRLQNRNHLSLEEAKQRISMQLDIEHKKQKAHDIIDNIDSLEMLQNNIEGYLQTLRSQYAL